MTVEDTIEEFIKDRLEEIRNTWTGLGALSWTVQGLCYQLEKVVEMHEKWPVLIERPPQLARVDATDISSLHYQMIQEMQFLTQEEYRRVFGDEPPTAPMVLSIARMWSNHPDFKEEWRE